MNILIVGNVLKDVYLNLDSRTETFETDKNGINWLDLSFDASEHYYFSRESSLGGAAVTLEVLSKLGLTSVVNGTNLNFTDDNPSAYQNADAHRYILIHAGQPTYLAPASHKTTQFTTPGDFYDFIYIDRSAHLDEDSLRRIESYLEFSQNTKLILYVQDCNSPIISHLTPLADLIFIENHSSDHFTNSPLAAIDPQKLIFLSDTELSYLDLHQKISPNRVNLLTHLSAFSIASATILGCFILGRSVEESLKFAQINLENSKLNATLSLSELQTLSENAPTEDNLELIAANLVLPPKGILAADESGGSIQKKFATLNIPDTYETRRDYRNMLISTPELSDYVNGVILFDETARQNTDNGQTFPDYLISHHIIPGIKVDQGLAPINLLNPEFSAANPDANSDASPDINFSTDPNTSPETYTKGLDDLPRRLKEYHNLGLRFAKWRAAFTVTLNDQGAPVTPTEYAIRENCHRLAEYAIACQNAGLVPIVEPEVIFDGNYSQAISAQVTANILDQLFLALEGSGVNLRTCILKCNMILAGQQYPTPSTPAEVGAQTALVLKAHVPPELAGVAFLSGGQTPEQATANLAAIIANGPFPWPVTFSFARALQDPALSAWQGQHANTTIAQDALKTRLIANVEALQPPDNQTP